jgi:hypothetical protein
MRHLIQIASLAWPVFAAAQAQSPPRIPLTTGDSVRVVMQNGSGFEGRLLHQTGDSVTFRIAHADGVLDTTVATSRMWTLETSVRHHARLKGTGLGFLAGGMAGGIAAGASMHGCTGDMCGMAILAVPIGAVIGGVIGLIGGSVHTSRDWELTWSQAAKQ